MDTALRHRVNAARVALGEQVRFFRDQFGQISSEWKDDHSRVTFADFAISEKIITELRRSFPGDDFCSEESNPADEEQILEAKYAWVLDPIDGTNNYALGLPFCAISLALLKEGMPVYGFLYDYCRDGIMEGGEGGIYVGRRRVDRPLRSFTRKEGIVGMHFPVRGEVYERVESVLTTYRVRSTGSGALNLAYAALGVLDGCLDHKVKVWDIAAAMALIKASGREMHFLDGNPFPLRTFHPNSPMVPYYAGSPEFCQVIADQLELSARP